MGSRPRYERDRVVFEVRAVGRRIAGKRVEHSWTQAELAQHATVSQSLVAQVELGRRHGMTLKAFLKMCEALDVSPEWVIYGDTGRPRRQN